MRWFAKGTTIMPYPNKRIEDAPPPFRRLHEHIDRLLHGHDLELVATVTANVMASVILALCPNRDVAEIDRTIDELAAALKAGCRARLERDRRETFQ